MNNLELPLDGALICLKRDTIYSIDSIALIQVSPLFAFPVHLDKNAYEQSPFLIYRIMSGQTNTAPLNGTDVSER